MIAGLAASARATPTRWRWPPESAAGSRAPTPSGRATSFSSSAMRAAVAALSQPASRGPTPMFSATVMCGKRPISWKT